MRSVAIISQRLLVGTLLWMIPAALLAQDPDDADQRPDCAALVSRARSAKAEPPSKYFSRWNAALACPGIASELSREWESPPADTVRLRALSHASSLVKDQQLFEALVQASSQSGAPLEARLHALAAVFGQFTVCSRIEFERHVAGGYPGGILYGPVSHYVSPEDRLAGQTPLVFTGARRSAVAGIVGPGADASMAGAVRWVLGLLDRYKSPGLC
jgi:hypothetical protein